MSGGEAGPVLADWALWGIVALAGIGVLILAVLLADSIWRCFRRPTTYLPLRLVLRHPIMWWQGRETRRWVAANYAPGEIIDLGDGWPDGWPSDFWPAGEPDWQWPR